MATQTRDLMTSAAPQQASPGAGRTRRRFLGWTAVAGVALAGALLGTGRASQPVRAQQQPAIVGSWLVTFPSGTDGPNAPQLASFTADGIVLGSNDPTSPPDPDGGPHATRTYSTPSQGVWVASGPGRVRLKFLEVETDDQGNFSDLVQITATLTLAADGNSFSGSFQVRVTDANGAVLFESPGDAGTVQGTRISV